MADTEAIYQSYVTYEEGKKSKFIELRDEQKAAVKAAKDYFEKSADNQRFLWNAKMRFGKTFCAMELAIEMGESEVDPKGKKDSKPISRVLIITHKPVVQDGFATDLKKLQESLKAKGHLKREWGFGTRSEKDDFGNFYDLEKNAKSQNRPYVFFSSTHWLCYSKEVGGAIDDPLRKAILNNDWDLVVIDEAHEGILADRGSVVISKLQECNPKMLYMSGTPFNLLEGTNGFSEEQIYSWDYIEEQRTKNEWNKKHPGETNPYQELPKMNIFAFNMGTLIPGKDYKKGDMFSFGEMFRTFVGRPEVDIVDGKPYKASKEEIGKFVHEADVQKFLDLMYLGDEKTNYPFTKEQYQENFRHTLWIVPGVKEAKALKELLEKHELFGSEDFKVVNVAGNSEVDENLNDLGRVKEAIKNYPYTITLSCAKLITGVTVPEWSAVFYMKGSADSSPATYMQTIFRVQSPHVYEENGEKRMKANCYVFDFAPGRSLKVVAATAKFARKTKTAKNKTNIITQNDEEIIKDFTTYCPIWQPVVAKAGSSLQPISTDDIITELNKVYVENIVKNGFDDNNIYLDDEILKLTDDVIQETKDIVDNIPGDGTVKKSDRTNISDDGGLTTTPKQPSPKERKTAQDKWKKEVEEGKTTEDFDTWFARKEEEKHQDEKLKSTRKLIHAITKRIPLLMFGAEVDDEKIGITINNITERIDDQSWEEFMPKGATKPYFEKIKHVYNDSMFKKAGTMIREMARETDEMHIVDRITKIAQIFNYFKNPDKETVLTPWRVVNLHMSQTLGGDCFFDSDFKGPNAEPVVGENGEFVLDENGNIKMAETKFPREVVNDTITKELFANIDEKEGESRTKILEINSKTGLYPLYVAYSLYRPLLDLYKEKHAIDDPDNVAISEEQAIWDTIIKKNLYVICNTDMAARITYRTLAGYREIQGVDTSTINEEHYVKGMHIVSDKLVAKAIEDKDALIKDIKTEGYWYNNKEDKKEMNFNAVVGNPPYQMTVAKKETDNGQKAVVNIFHHFQLISDGVARYTSLIYPGGRWIHRSGKGLEVFGKNQINDKHLKLVCFYPDANEIFAEAGISDGISIVSKDNDSNSSEFEYCYCVRNDVMKVTLPHPGDELIPLNPYDASILNCIRETVSEKKFDFLHDSVLSRSVFSIESDFVEKNPTKVRAYDDGDQFDRATEIKLFTNDKAGKAGRARWFIAKRKVITTGTKYLDDWKVIVSSANAGGQKRSNQLAIIDNYSAFGRSRVALKTFKTKEEAENFYKYCKTELIRFAFLMTDEALTSLAKQVPDIKNYKNDNGIIDFEGDVNEQLYTLFGIKDSKTRKYIREVLSTKADAEKSDFEEND